MKSGFGKIAFLLFVMLLNIGCDQKTKQIAKETLMHEPSTSYVNDIFRLVYAENNGAFLSMGSGLPDDMRYLVLSILPIIVLGIMLLYTLFSKELTFYQSVAMAFIIGGGFSNILDRLVNDGRVVDFMNMGLGSLRTGIFNFADLSIVFGMIAFLLLGFVNNDKEQATTTP